MKKVYVLFCVFWVLNAAAFDLNKVIKSLKNSAQPRRIVTPPPKQGQPNAQPRLAPAVVAVAESPNSLGALEQLEKKWIGKELEFRCCASTCCAKNMNGDVKRYTCDIRPDTTFAKGSLGFALSNCYRGTNHNRYAFEKISDFDTLVLRNGERISFKMTEVEARLKTANPNLPNLADNTYFAFFNCEHAMAKPFQPDQARMKKERSIFLEVNKCVPRTKIYDNFLLMDRADKVGWAGNHEEALAIYQKLCDDNDADACYRGGLSVGAFGEDNAELRVKLLKRGCDLGFSHSCDTWELWDEDFIKYTKKKAAMVKACDTGGDDACMTLVRFYGSGQQHNMSEAKRIGAQKCAAKKIPFCTELGTLEYGLLKNHAEARKIWSQACAGGDREACDLIKRTAVEPPSR